MGDSPKHISVLLNECIENLNIKPDGIYVDGTLGLGGHSEQILKRLTTGRLIGIDRDESAIRRTGERLKEYSDKMTLVHGNFCDVAQILDELGIAGVDGMLFDLGVSSPQLDESERGFSYMADAPLDMRMDRSEGTDAGDLVNGESAERLSEIFRELGEEPQARRIAKAIVQERERGGRFETTTQLADFVERVVGRHGGRHPATRVFQALRMAVNDECGELERALNGGMELLKAGGRFAVITFESITDRKVKRFFAEHVGKMQSLQQGGEEWAGEEPRARAVTRRAVVAGEEEVNLNPRSRSAKLRVIERTGT